MTSKSLIVDYSWSGHTATMAKALQKVSATDLIDLTVADDTFSTDMFATSKIATQQLASDQLPALTNELPALADYQTIFVGGPVWSGKVSTPVRTFLSQLGSYQGTVVPFYTDAGTAGDYEADFQNLLTNASFKPGIGLSGDQLAQAETRLKTWWKKFN
ncbi:flavodoxin [Lactiplantibacillus pingfangensis]|uniref:flavodoxin n=1 Tax=Lactiplantibacillus pingfangensis TaxID=2559915 RepID=UPI0010F76C0D|nr:flavodoxin [Lactiplantibacillus pingfangensis]